MKHSLVGLSLFANAGIAETYLGELGIEIAVANEIVDKRARFYSHLYPGTEMIIGDIADKKVRENITIKSIEKGVNFVIATPPCQGMSLAGKMDPLDQRNQLIFYTIDLIKRLMPKYVLIENVPQQLKTKIKHQGKLLTIPDYIANKLGKNYNFNKDFILSAKDYGVPQMRRRSIILLSRKDQEYVWQIPPRDNELVTLRDALYSLPPVDPYLKEGLKETVRLFPDFDAKRGAALKLSKWHRPPTHAKKHVLSMMHTPTGRTAHNNRLYYPKKDDGTRVNGHENTYRRLEWDKPSRTITQNNGVISSLACVHPGRKTSGGDSRRPLIYSDPRCFTIYELMIVTSLPTDWNIPEWADDKTIRSVIGEGIPPILVKKICAELVKNIS